MQGRKKLLKKVMASITVALFIAMQYFVVFAEDPMDWQNKGASGANSVSNTTAKIATVGVSIHTIIQMILYIIGFLNLMWYGAKWMMAGSDSTKKKELKEGATNYLIGSFILFGAAFIYGLVYKFANGF